LSDALTTILALKILSNFVASIILKVSINVGWVGAGSVKKPLKE
jgi:hypothetical protein